MAAEVREKILQLHQSPDPAVRQQADAALRNFQETDAAWGISQSLLGDAEPNVQFFGAQTLSRRVQKAAQGYAEPAAGDLKDWVPFLLQHAQSGTNPSKQQLVIALASIAVALCTTSWTTAVFDLVQLAESQPKIAWGTLLIIPEQLSNVVHKYLKTDVRTVSLLKGAQLLLESAARCRVESATAGEATGTLADSEFSLALQTVTQWSKVMGLQIIQHQTFARHLIALIGSPSVNLDVVLDTVLEVLRRSAGAFMIYEPAQSAAPALQSILAAVTQAMSQLLPTLQQHAASAAVLEEEDAQRLARWAEVAGSLIEAYTQLLWLDPETSEVLLRFIAACFMVHPRVGQAVSELWAILKDAKRDGKLPENVMPKILHRLVEPSVLSFTRFGRFDSKFTDDRADLVQLRSAQQDILVDMYCVAAGTAEAQLVLGTLLKPLESADILGQEVVWYAFQGIAEVIADEPSIPNEYNVVLPSVFRVTGGPAEALATGAALLRACGPHFEQRLQAHLAPAVQWLVSMVAHVPNEASETVQELCGYAGKLLLPHLEEFLKVVDQVAPKAPAEVDACLYGALAGIARNLPAEQAAAGFAKVCNSAAATLQGIDTSSEAGRMTLHRVLGRILRCDFVMRQAGPAAANGVAVSPEARLASVCLAGFLLSCWPVVAAPCQSVLLAAQVTKEALKGRPMYEYSDVAVQVNVLALLRRAGAASYEAESEPLAQQVTQLVASCQAGQPAVLMAAAQLAAHPGLAQKYLLPQLEVISNTALMRSQNGRAEDLIPFLDLCSALATSVGDAVFSSQLLAPLCRLCVAALASAEHDVLKPALLFLQRLLTTRAVQLGEADVGQLAQAVVASFSQWPRSMNTQIFKVFSALAERHERVYLATIAASAGAPCMASLSEGDRRLAQQALARLRGPKLRALLADLAAVQRGERGADMLQSYVE